MAWQDRTYNREGFGGGMGGGGFGSRLGSRSVVTWLLGINCAVFLLDLVLGGAMRGGGLSPTRWGAFSVIQAVDQFQVWRFFTYQFLHSGLLHIFFNMLALYFFGPMLESWWGSRRFIAFYLLCGMCGALLFWPLVEVGGIIPATRGSILVGASGSIFGVLLGAARIAPNQTVMLLIPPIPMKLRTMAYVLVGMNVLMVLAGSGDSGGAAAHLGGAALGLLLVQKPNLLNWADRLNLPQRAQRKPKPKPDPQVEVDRILDKVRDRGLHSLTSREKKTLRRATDEKRNTG